MKRMVLIAGLSLALLCGCNNSTQSTDPSIIAAKDFIKNAVEKNQFVDNSDDVVTLENSSYNYDDNELIYNFIVPYINYNDTIRLKELLISSAKKTYFSSQQKKEVIDAMFKARTILIYNFHTKDGESLKIKILPSELESYIKNNLRTQSTDNISAKEYIKNHVSAENHMCPNYLDNGCVLESVIYDNENNVVIYNFLMPYLSSNKSYEQVKEDLLLTQIQSSHNDDLYKKFIEALILSKTTLTYNYRTKDGYSQKISILPSELESCIKNNTYQ